MKKNTLKSLVLAISLAFSAVAAQADSMSWANADVGAGSAVIFGSSTHNVGYHGSTDTVSYNGVTSTEIGGGTNGGVVGVYGVSTGGAQGDAVAVQTPSAASVDTNASSSSGVWVIGGYGTSNSGAGSTGSAKSY